MKSKKIISLIATFVIAVQGIGTNLFAAEQPLLPTMYLGVYNNKEIEVKKPEKIPMMLNGVNDGTFLDPIVVQPEDYVLGGFANIDNLQNVQYQYIKSDIKPIFPEDTDGAWKDAAQLAYPIYPDAERVRNIESRKGKIQSKHYNYDYKQGGTTASSVTPENRRTYLAYPINQGTILKDTYTTQIPIYKDKYTTDTIGNAFFHDWPPFDGDWAIGNIIDAMFFIYNNAKRTFTYTVQVDESGYYQFKVDNVLFDNDIPGDWLDILKTASGKLEGDFLGYYKIGNSYWDFRHIYLLTDNWAYLDKNKKYTITYASFDAFKYPKLVCQQRVGIIFRTQEVDENRLNSWIKDTQVQENIGNKAVKYWGYLIPTEDRILRLKLDASEYAEGYIIENGKKRWITSKDEEKIFSFIKDKVYPIYLEWRHGESSDMHFILDMKTGLQTYKYPRNWFYASNDETPAEDNTAYFDPIKLSIKMPLEGLTQGTYYLAIKANTTASRTQKVLYGPLKIESDLPIMQPGNNTTNAIHPQGMTTICYKQEFPKKPKQVKSTIDISHLKNQTLLINGSNKPILKYDLNNYKVVMKKQGDTAYTTVYEPSSSSKIPDYTKDKIVFDLPHIDAGKSEILIYIPTAIQKDIPYTVKQDRIDDNNYEIQYVNQNGTGKGKVTITTEVTIEDEELSSHTDTKIISDTIDLYYQPVDKIY